MKQYITVNQLNELSPKAKEILRNWWKPQMGDMVLWDDLVGPLTENGEGMWDDLSDPDWDKNDYLPLLSIGQMIEFLDENKDFRWAWDTEGAWLTGSSCLFIGVEEDKKISDLCDLLWKEVKGLLERNV